MSILKQQILAMTAHAKMAMRPQHMPWRRPAILMAMIFALCIWQQAIAQDAPPAQVQVSTQVSSQAKPVPMSLNLPGAFQKGRNIHDLGALEPKQIAKADQEAAEKYRDLKPGPARVGLVRSIGKFPLAFDERSALRLTSAEGKTAWTMAIRSPGAFGMRIHFSHFEVGPAAVMVYAQGVQGVVAHGPYTGKGPNGNGDFWTATLPGEVTFIEVSGTNAPRLKITEILHFDKNPAGSNEDKNGAAALLPCHVDVRCFGQPLVHPIARDATVQMNYTDGGLGYVCTGTILNDLDDETAMPYFLTAYHCISTQVVTNTLEVVFFWHRDACNGTLPNYFALPRMNGGALLGTNSTASGNDMSFIRLNGDLPGGSGLAGWTTAAPPASFAGIHHPGGSWKRVTIQHVESVVSPCQNTPTSQYHYTLQDSGITEGGSSGSGIFDSGARLMGQLLGSCPPFSGFVYACNNRNQYNNIYGRFSVTYPIIRRWLEIGGTIHIDRAYGGTELGTPTQPFNTVGEANNFAWDGARLKIKTGSYPETLTITKQVTLVANGGVVTIGL